jgi:dUTP pyrophosphatase
MTTYDTFKIHMAMYERERGENTTLQVKKLHPDAIVPTRGTPVAAGLDLYALEAGEMGPLQTTLVSTGIAIALPPGYEGQVRPRSGLAAKFGVSVTNSPGTIDEDYRGELKVLLQTTRWGQEFKWNKGDRIAQLVIVRAHYFGVNEVAELDSTTRGTNGFGSTGK